MSQQFAKRLTPRRRPAKHARKLHAPLISLEGIRAQGQASAFDGLYPVCKVLDRPVALIKVRLRQCPTHDQVAPQIEEVFFFLRNDERRHDGKGLDSKPSHLNGNAF